MTLIMKWFPFIVGTMKPTMYHSLIMKLIMSFIVRE